jgi:hypothetical protein
LAASGSFLVLPTSFAAVPPYTRILSKNKSGASLLTVGGGGGLELEFIYIP